ncbi:MAG: DUF309 domain-containing protein [Halolamina sp.]
MSDALGPLPVAEALRAGAAAYNAGEYAAARAVWAGTDSESGTPPLLDGLAAFADAVARGRQGEWTAATAAADRATERLDSDDIDGRGVTVAALRRWLDAFRADPERIERRPVPPVSVAGEHPVPGTLSLAAAGAVASVVADRAGYDTDVVADAVRFARAEEHPAASNYATFLRDFVGDPAQRPIIFQRLSGMVERERRKERDVDGLFDESDEA